MLAMKSQGTDTSIIVDASALTSATIDAQIVAALIGDSGLAVLASPARRAGTGIRTLACVEASGTILARLVVRAVVQVLIAKKATPAFLTVASPWLIAGSMLAAWVLDAILAELASPAISTLAFAGLVTISVLVMTSRTAHSFCAIVSFFVIGIFLPSVQADFVSIRITSIMTELVISWSAQGVTVFAIIMGRAHHSVLVF
jgi:hypothetical protein